MSYLFRAAGRRRPGAPQEDSVTVLFIDISAIPKKDRDSAFELLTDAFAGRARSAAGR